MDWLGFQALEKKKSISSAPSSVSRPFLHLLLNYDTSIGRQITSRKEETSKHDEFLFLICLQFFFTIMLLYLLPLVFCADYLCQSLRLPDYQGLFAHEQGNISVGRSVSQSPS